MKSKLYIAFVGLVALACSPGATPSSTDESHQEDLERLRPELVFKTDSSTKKKDSIIITEDYADITPTFDVTTELDALLDSIVKIRSDIKYVDGFTILVYSGTNSEQAHISKGKVYSILPDARPKLKFDEPNFRVKVGKYYSRLEAQKDYSALKEKFSKAIIIPERIYIN